MGITVVRGMVVHTEFVWLAKAFVILGSWSATLWCCVLGNKARQVSAFILDFYADVPQYADSFLLQVSPGW